MCFVFVFAALLEYAAVNYSYWGERARRKKAGIKVETFRGDDQEGAIDFAMRDWHLPNANQHVSPPSPPNHPFNRYFTSLIH